MIGVGSLVKYKGNRKQFYDGKMLMVHERNGDTIVVYKDQKANGKWTTTELNVKDVEEVR